MGCLIVILMWSISAGLIFLAGWEPWVMVVLGVLWLAGGIVSWVGGHTGFGTGTNTDLQIVLAAAFITAAIMIPQYADRQPCNQAGIALKKLVEAEDEYFAKHKAFATDIKLLNFEPGPQVQIKITRSDEKSISAAVSHPSCDNNGDGKPDVLTWDSAGGRP